MKFVKKYDNYYEGENQNREVDFNFGSSVGNSIRSKKSIMRSYCSSNIESISNVSNSYNTITEFITVGLVIYSYYKLLKENPDKEFDFQTLLNGIFFQKLF